jgi:hypothetical protein
MSAAFDSELTVPRLIYRQRYQSAAGALYRFECHEFPHADVALPCCFAFGMHRFAITQVIEKHSAMVFYAAPRFTARC